MSGNLREEIFNMKILYNFSWYFIQNIMFYVGQTDESQFKKNK